MSILDWPSTASTASTGYYPQDITTYFNKYIKDEKKPNFILDRITDIPLGARGSITEGGTFTNSPIAEAAKEDEETPAEDLQYFDPKDLDI